MVASALAIRRVSKKESPLPGLKSNPLNLAVLTALLATATVCPTWPYPPRAGIVTNCSNLLLNRHSLLDAQFGAIGIATGLHWDLGRSTSPLPLSDQKSDRDQ